MRLGTFKPLTQIRRLATHTCFLKPLHRLPRSHTASVICSATLSKTMQQYTLVHNGQLVPCDVDSKQWLKHAPRGAYTTARTMNGDLVFMLSSHIQRLATSANLMMDADARASDHMTADTPLFHSDSLRPLVVDCMRVAIQGLRQQQQQRKEGEHIQGLESKLTLLLMWGGDGTPDLWCHAEPLLPRPDKPVKVMVKGLPRVNAKAKDSEWVRQRQALEAAKPSDVNEVLLVSQDGAMTEGLTSNFFVLSKDGEVVTAQDGVLDGTVRQVILKVCGEHDVPVRLEAPSLSDIDSWQGAFISSTSRLLLPVSEVMYEVNGQQQRKVFPEQHPLVQQLNASVAAHVLDSSEPLQVSAMQAAV